MQPNEIPRQRIYVHQIVNQLLQTYSSKLTTMRISLETDIESVSAVASPQNVESATRALLENAISAMPEGGDLSVTLVDGPDQWELEIADNATRNHPETSKIQTAASLDSSIQVAKHAATEQGGEIQTWNCPLGGQAHVLVVPRN